MSVGIDRPLDAITFQDIDDLVQAGQGEFTNLEFKADFPSANEQGKSELAKDLTAFANTDGGDIVYGVQQDKAGGALTPYKVCGVERNRVDAFIQRLTQIARDRCYPPLSDYDPPKSVDIPNTADRCLVVVRVRPSLVGPHSSELRLPVYVRRINTNAPVNIIELREHMDAKEALVDRAAAWRANQLRRLHDGHLPCGIGMHYSRSPGSATGSPMPWHVGSQLFVIHFLPLASFRRVPAIDAFAAWQRPPGPVVPVLFYSQEPSACGMIPVRDGLLAYWPNSPAPALESVLSYTMLFRWGAVELASPNILAIQGPPSLRPDVYSTTGQTTISSTLKACLKLLEQLRIPPPILLGFHLACVKGVRIPPTDESLSITTIGEDDITSDEYRLDSYQDDVDRLLTLFLDIVANAAGQWKFNRGRTKRRI